MNEYYVFPFANIGGGWLVRARRATNAVARARRTIKAARAYHPDDLGVAPSKDFARYYN